MLNKEKASKISNRIDALIRFFLYVLIFWLPYSLAVIEISVTAGLFLWLVKRTYVFLASIRSKEFKRAEFFLVLKESFSPRVSPLNLSIGLFIFACFLSISGSIFLFDSLRGFLSKTMEWFIVYFLVLEVFNDRRSILIALGVFLFTAFSTSLDGIYQFYISSKDVFLGNQIDLYSRATAGFNTANDLGGYLTFVIPIVVSLQFLKIKNLIVKFLIFLILIFTGWAMIITYTRGAWIAVFLGVLFFFFLQRRKSFFVLIFFSLLFCILFIWLQPEKIAHVFQGFGNDRAHSMDWRDTIWKQTLNMIGEAPVFGHGPNTFMKIFQFYSPQAEQSPTYAHNCYLQLTAEVGILGMAIFFFILFFIFSGSLSRLRSLGNEGFDLEFKLSQGILGGVLAFLVHSFSDTNFYGLQLSVHFWVLVGILFSINNLLDKNLRYGINKS